jgi:hypothetical protein
VTPCGPSPVAVRVMQLMLRKRPHSKAIKSWESFVRSDVRRFFSQHFDLRTYGLDLPPNTRHTREEGTGFGGVAECLPPPIPVHTLPATRTGDPYPCCSLSMVRIVFGALRQHTIQRSTFVRRPPRAESIFLSRRLINLPGSQLEIPRVNLSKV